MTVTDEPAAPAPNLTAALAALTAQLADVRRLALGGARGVEPLAIPSTGHIPNVTDGALIETAWGNAIRSRTTERYDNLAQLKSQLPTPGDGDLAYLLDEGSTLVGKGGTWRWLTKEFGVTVGANTPYWTWAATATLATSQVGAALSGRTLTTRVHAIIAAPNINFNASIGTWATAYQMPGIAHNQPAVAVSTAAGGALWSARSILQPGGSLQAYWQQAPSTCGTFLALVSYPITDLIAA